jgi:predicted RNase H-like HicB family nuclease
MQGNTRVKTRRFAVIIDRDLAGYSAFCPQFRGSYTLGRTYQETLRNLECNIMLYLAARSGCRGKIAQPEFIRLTWDELMKMPDKAAAPQT